MAEAKPARRTGRPTIATTPSPTASNPHMARPPTIRNRSVGYRVLVLDGGGYRGYASLLMLKCILRGVVPAGPIFPYQYFDLVCGTSTGGLIALLLGVLRLDIDHAIRLYKGLAKTLFTSTWRWMRWLFRDERFSSRTLKEEMSTVIRDNGYEGKKLFDPEQPDRENDCKCFVTTATKPRGQAPIRLLRSYRDPSHNVWPHPWTILDAALATSAARTYFRCHVVNYEDTAYHYEDAGIHGLNNPAVAAWDECDLLNPDTSPYCIISLGTGLKRHDPSENNTPAPHWILDTLQNLAMIPSRLRTLSKHLSNEATKVEGKHKEMERLTRKLNPNPYFRFNPDIDAMGNISLADHEATARMDHAVYGYINKNQALFDRCIERLKAYPGCPDLQQDPFADPPTAHTMEVSNPMDFSPQAAEGSSHPANH